MKFEYFKNNISRNTWTVFLAPLFMILITKPGTASARAHDSSEGDYSLSFGDEITNIAQARYEYADKMANNPEFIKIKSDIDSASSVEKNPAFLDPDYPNPFPSKDCASSQSLHGLAVPDKSVVVPDGPIFTLACTIHNQAYGRLGSRKKLIDQQFLNDLNLAVETWLATPVKVVSTIKFKRHIVEPVYKTVVHFENIFPSPPPNPLAARLLEIMRKQGHPVPNTQKKVFEEVKVGTRTKTVVENKTVVNFLPRLKINETWGSLLRKQVQTIYEALTQAKNPKTGRLISDESFEQAQSDARTYHQWLMFYFALHPIEN